MIVVLAFNPFGLERNRTVVAMDYMTAVEHRDKLLMEGFDVEFVDFATKQTIEYFPQYQKDVLLGKEEE